jgi:hypothetical protein
VFLGSEVALKLFGNSPAVGETVRINGMAFTVVGVQKEKIQLSNYNRPTRRACSSRTPPPDGCGIPST